MLFWCFVFAICDLLFGCCGVFLSGCCVFGVTMGFVRLFVKAWFGFVCGGRLCCLLAGLLVVLCLVTALREFV